MPELTFTIPDASRSMNTPACDSWTYHHILPYRYFRSAAYILIKLIRLLELKVKKDQGGDLGTALAEEFGASDALDVLNDLEVNKREVIEICANLHHSPGTSKEITDLRTFPGPDLSDPDVIMGTAKLLGNPKYGGFAAMDPGHRADDPKSGREKNRPPSFNAEQWKTLKNLGNVLERAVPKITAGEKGEYTCKLSVPDAKELIHDLRVLRDTYNSLVPGFEASDWKMTTGWEWYYLEDLPIVGDPQQIVRLQECGIGLFKIAEDALGGSRVKKSELAHATKQTRLVVRKTVPQNKLEYAQIA